MSKPSILVQFQAATLISEGYISALVSDLRKLPEYWAGMLKDFPRHPVKDADPELRASIGCTLYGFLACKHQSFSLRGWGGGANPLITKNVETAYMFFPNVIIFPPNRR